MKFIHCADIHLDSPFSLKTPEEALRRRTDLRSDFASLMLLARTEKCDMVFISGDLFDDSTVTKDTFELLYREISSLPDCLFFISPGNHDPYYEKSPYKLMKLPENVHIFTKESLSYVDVPEHNARIYGYAFTEETKKDSPITSFKVEDEGKINILVAHGEVCSGISYYCPLYEKDIAATGFDYVALGHIHKSEGLRYAGSVPYAYSGCIEGRGFDETGYKGALLGEITDDKLDIKPVRIARRRFEIVKCDVTGASSLADAAGKISSACAGFGSDTALRVILEGLTDEGFSADDESVKAIVPAPYRIEIKDNTLPLFNANKLKGDKTVVGEFYRGMEKYLVSDDVKEREIAVLALKYGLRALYGRDLNT